jgi:hypothetical protein
MSGSASRYATSHGINLEDGFPPPEQILDFRAGNATSNHAPEVAAEVVQLARESGDPTPVRAASTPTTSLGRPSTRETESSLAQLRQPPYQSGYVCATASIARVLCAECEMTGADVCNRRIDAHAHLTHAARMHEPMGAPIWLARTRLATARLLLDKGQPGTRTEGREMLDRVIEVAQATATWCSSAGRQKVQQGANAPGRN